MKLNLGCGNLAIPGYDGVDQYPGPGVVYVQDLKEPRWLFPDDSVDGILAWHVLEHMPDLALDRAMREIFRILKPGGTVYIKVPLGLKQLRNPFHFHAFDPNSFSCWIDTPGNRPPVSLEDFQKFREVRKEIVALTGFPLWHLHHYFPNLRGRWVREDERGIFARYPTTGTKELRLWLEKPRDDSREAIR